MPGVGVELLLKAISIHDLPEVTLLIEKTHADDRRGHQCTEEPGSDRGRYGEPGPVSRHAVSLAPDPARAQVGLG